MHGNGFRTLPSFAIIVCAILIATPNTTGQQTEPCRVGSPKQLSFSAEIKIHSVQTLADGTTITRDDKGLVARDSQGRTLNVTTSQPFAPEISEESAITFATVDDPVAGTQTRWHSRSRKATVLKMPSERYGCWTNGSGASWNFGPRIPQVSAARSPCESKSNRSVGGGQMTRPDASAPPPNASGAPPAR